VTRLRIVFRFKMSNNRSASSFRDAPLGAGPESILPMVVMDSGLAAARRPGMTTEFEGKHQHSRGMICPSFASTSSLENRGSRECRALSRTRSLVCRRVEGHTSISHHSRRNAGIPCAMVERLLRALPGVPGLLATVAYGISSADLIPASGDQNHTA
jgi:hypothetical protein